jgi:hypothetical protein
MTEPEKVFICSATWSCSQLFLSIYDSFIIKIIDCS